MYDSCTDDVAWHRLAFAVGAAHAGWTQAGSDAWRSGRATDAGPPVSQTALSVLWQGQTAASIRSEVVSDMKGNLYAGDESGTL